MASEEDDSLPLPSAGGDAVPSIAGKSQRSKQLTRTMQLAGAIGATGLVDKAVLCVGDFERRGNRVIQVAGSAVRLRAAERDLLMSAENTIDYFQDLVKGKREDLRETFGGSRIMLFHRIRATMEKITLSEMHEHDTRWKELREIMDLIEILLKEFGLFKVWDVTRPPAKLVYEGVPKHIVPGNWVTFDPDMEGGMATSYTVTPDLPRGLVLNTTTGAITGMIEKGVEVPMRTYIIKGSNASGGTTVSVSFAVKSKPPAQFEMDKTILEDMIVGQPIQMIPNAHDDYVSEWRITPSQLPLGLTLDPKTGVISGIVTKQFQRQQFTLYARNRSGEVSTTFYMKVRAAAPKSLRYNFTTDELYAATAVHITPAVEMERSKKEVPSGWKLLRSAVRSTYTPDLSTVTLLLVQGLKFTIEPSLPDNLHLVERTGVITGRLAGPQEKRSYKITATNESGSAQCTVSFGACYKAPDDMKYIVNADASYSVGKAMTIAPVVTGHVDEWKVASNLPKGLILTSAGVISGVPLESGEYELTITASNATGSTQCKVKFTVRLPPPENLSYPLLQKSYPVGRPIESLRPEYEGVVDEWTVAPDLPSGLRMVGKTGEIVGTPGVATKSTLYVVTAKNKAGTSSVKLNFETQLMPPNKFSYNIDDIYHYGEEVDLKPDLEGGATEWEICPPLPAGLVFDKSTGCISGAPTVTMPETKYVVCASNEAGGTSIVIQFMITAPKPIGLAFPGWSEEITVEQVVDCEPTVESGVCCEFAIEPALPNGLELNPKTGAITGAPSSGLPRTHFHVTASNIAGTASTWIFLTVLEPPTHGDILIQFAVQIESVTDVAALLANEPSRTSDPMGWMVWMVHRAYLNDPSLVVFAFTGMSMPLGHIQPCIAPKLMTALGSNTHITHFEMCATNLQAAQGEALAESLSTNRTLKVMNIESNFMDTMSMLPVIHALRDSTDSALEQLRFSNQNTIGNNFGRQFEEQVALMVEKNTNIVKLGYVTEDPNWRYKIDKALLRNNDIARRKRKAGTANMKIEQRDLKLLRLLEPPDKGAWEFFSDDDPKMMMVRKFVAKEQKAPVSTLLQKFGNSVNIKLSFAEVGPLIKNFNAALAASAIDTEVEVTEPNNKKLVGVMTAATEKNQRWVVQLRLEGDAQIAFSSKDKADLAIQCSPEYYKWLAPPAS